MKVQLALAVCLAGVPVSVHAQFAGSFWKGFNEQRDLNDLNSRIDRALEICSAGGEGARGACAAVDVLIRQKEALLSQRQTDDHTRRLEEQQRSLDEANQRLQRIQECLRSGQQGCH